MRPQPTCCSKTDGAMRDVTQAYTASRRAFFRSALVGGATVLTLPLMEEEAEADVFRPSANDQKKLGERAAEDILKKEKEVKDDRARSFNRVATSLIDALSEKERGPWDFRFRVLDNKEVNAFALPGGNIFIYTGLLDKIASRDELAAVTAHEIVHVRDEHWARAYADQMKRSLGLEILLGATRAKGAIRDIAGVANSLWSLKYSRGEEDSADAKGLQNMVTAKYEPEGMLDLFQTLTGAAGGKDGGTPEFLRSHPMTKDRVRKTEERIQKLRDRG